LCRRGRKGIRKPKRRKPLIYYNDFKAAVLAVFPSSERIRLILVENSFSLGYSLSGDALSSISPSLVIALLEAGKAEELLKVAKTTEERKLF
jgi:hypothetical protein